MVQAARCFSICQEPLPPTTLRHIGYNAVTSDTAGRKRDVPAKGFMPVARLGCLAGLAVAMSLSCQIASGQDEAREKLLLGCWEHTSPYPRDRLPPDRREWGTTTWRFEKEGRIITRMVACGRIDGCDGWEEEREYRWRENLLEIDATDLDPNSPTYMTWIWRACRPVFAGRDRMSLQDCAFSPYEWIRAREAN